MAPMVKRKMPSSSSLRVKHDPIELYESFVNPQWVRLLDILQMNVSYVRCVGCERKPRMGVGFWISIPVTAFITLAIIIPE
jgi:hypothetical protein